MNHREKKTMFVCGDFNYDLLEHSKLPHLHPPSDLRRQLHHLWVTFDGSMLQTVPKSPETPRTKTQDNMFGRILTLLEEMKETKNIKETMQQTLLQELCNICLTFSSPPEGFQRVCQKLANPNFMSELVC